MENTTQELQAVAAAEPQPTVAVVGEVRELMPIPFADRIQLAIVDCGEHGAWSGVVTKDIEHESRVLVLLQDALLPESERWAFMSKHKWRVRMARFKGVPSECVILPLTLDEAMQWSSIGIDVGAHFGITKYSKPIPAEMAGKAKGNFPSLLEKTDEPNFQRCRGLDEIMAGEWEARVKYDGTSCTVFNTESEPGDPVVQMHVCSRNLELDPAAGGVYWEMAKKYELYRVPVGYALQFEIIGPGIQGNPLGLEAPEIRVFTLYDIASRRKAPVAQLDRLCSELQLPRAELIVAGSGPLPQDTLRWHAERTKYSNGRQAEGIVIRDLESKGSFKVLSLTYEG